MLITERTSNGRTIVTLHKDWHPQRISVAYVPHQRNYVDSTDMQLIQAALLDNPSQRGAKS